MKSKKIALTALVLLIGASALLVVATSYSWIRRDWAPKFYTNELTVQTSGSLAIMLDGNSATYSEVDLNSVLNLGAFKLKQVSSQTGLSDDFYSIDYTEGHGKEKLVHISAGDSGESYTAMALRNGYVEAKFLVVCKAEVENQVAYDKYVFFDPTNCYIRLVSGTGSGSANASDAMRISISVEGSSSGGVNRPTLNYIFKNGVRTHSGAKGPVNGVYTIDGSYIYLLEDDGSIKAHDTSLIGNSVAYNFEDFNGGYATGQAHDPDNLDLTKVLFSMANVDQRWVTIRIWLEGYDTNCSDDIAGSKIELKLTFISVDKERQT